MAIWAIADLHLSFGVPNKSMDVFGDHWRDHADKIEENWRQAVGVDDLVLLPGDISWAMRLEDALADLEWIDKLPGTKVMLRGNHDYWWSSMKKMAKVMPSSINLIHNTAFHWQGVGVAGTRLWDSWEYNFNSYIERVERADTESTETKEPQSKEEAERIFLRELQRLEISLQCLARISHRISSEGGQDVAPDSSTNAREHCQIDKARAFGGEDGVTDCSDSPRGCEKSGRNPEVKTRIVMTHYPPISADLQPSRVSALLEKYDVDICVFGHLHNVNKEASLFGKKGNTSYFLTSADYLDFKPIQIL